MTDRKLMFIDIETKSQSSTHINNSVWSKSDNSFKFDFIHIDRPAPVKPTSPTLDEAEPARGWFSMKEQGSSFSFNFKLPAVEQMETTETHDISSQNNQEGAQEQTSQDVSSLDHVVLQTKSKKKKKKKSGKSQTSLPPHESGSAQVNEAGKDTALSAEEQLNRQLDWCIEQMELGMKSLKTTPKQKEEASRALKTLRSSKAPLAKKRQVMRAMTGDYRQKMEEEKKKQHKMIQNELASAQVKVVSDSPKKCVFNRRGRATTQKVAAVEETLQQPKAQTSQTQEGTQSFVFVPAKEKFCFNFF